MVGILGDQNLGHGGIGGRPPSISRAGAGAAPRPLRRPGSRAFGRRTTKDSQLGWDDVQPLADVLTDPMQRVAEHGTGMILNIDDPSPIRGKWAGREPRFRRRLPARLVRALGSTSSASASPLATTCSTSSRASRS